MLAEIFFTKIVFLRLVMPQGFRAPVQSNCTSNYIQFSALCLRILAIPFHSFRFEESVKMVSNVIMTIKGRVVRRVIYSTFPGIVEAF